MVFIAFTIGHSNQSIEAFLSLLHDSQITVLVDVRSSRTSRHNPQYEEQALRESVESDGIRCVALPRLGGHRSGQPAARLEHQMGWKVAAFRQYAAYATTATYQQSLKELLHLIEHERCVIMCAEVLWWRCHRRIVTDYLLMHGIRVKHILGKDQITDAKMTEFAEPKDDGIIDYPASAD